MFKKFLKLIKKNEVDDEVAISIEEEILEESIDERICTDVENIEETKESIAIEEKVKENDLELGDNKEQQVECVEEIIVYGENKEFENDSEIDEDVDLEYIKQGKIKREKSIKAIDLYTQEEQIFKTHKECSRKLRVPLGYIKENLKYGYTDYLGDAINFLSKELQMTGEDGDDFSYLDNSKNPMEIFNILNNKIFISRISENKRDYILSSIKIEPIKMHYRFECIDEEYDDYFKKYKSIIKRGGKKKIELVDKKGEAIEVFKSMDDCAAYLGKEKSEVVEMLKYGEIKVGRYDIRYSLRNI